MRKGWDKGGESEESLFYPSASFTLLENIKFWRKIQEIHYCITNDKIHLNW